MKFRPVLVILVLAFMAGCARNEYASAPGVSYPYPVYARPGSVGVQPPVSMGAPADDNDFSTGNESLRIQRLRQQLAGKPELRSALPRLDFREEAGILIISGDVSPSEKELIENTLSDLRIVSRTELNVTGASRPMLQPFESPRDSAGPGNRAPGSKPIDDDNADKR